MTGVGQYKGDAPIPPPRWDGKDTSVSSLWVDEEASFERFGDFSAGVVLLLYGGGGTSAAANGGGSWGEGFMVFEDDDKTACAFCP